MSSRLARLGASLLLSVVSAHGTSLAHPVPGTQSFILLEGMPSFYQRNIEFDGGGKNFCGPTAASNALMWLADHGYPNLKPTAENGPRAQTEMIKRLACLMGTYRQGTSVASFSSGIKSYLDSVGYSYKSWSFSGNSYAHKSQSPPDIGLVKAMSTGKTAIWLSVGWYDFDESCKKFTRHRGHWVTLAGYESDQGEGDSPARLLVADPESPDKHKYVTLKKLNEGKLTDGQLRAEAKGYFNLVELDRETEDSRKKYCVLETIEVLTLE